MNCYYCGRDAYDANKTNIKDVLSKWLILPEDVLVSSCVGCRQIVDSDIFQQIVKIIEQDNTITDDYQTWSKTCPMCGQDTMQVVRPGKVQCSNCG